jgi:hypothetical protein
MHVNGALGDVEAHPNNPHRYAAVWVSGLGANKLRPSYKLVAYHHRLLGDGVTLLICAVERDRMGGTKAISP